MTKQIREHDFTILEELQAERDAAVGRAEAAEADRVALLSYLIRPRGPSRNAWVAIRPLDSPTYHDTREQAEGAVLKRARETKGGER